jgi:transaldolase/glucose-6-phosphate isomerase
MAKTPIHALFENGQSVWLDFIQRNLLTTGELARQVNDGILSGLTSNPTIFEKAIGGSRDYDEEFDRLARAGASPSAILDALMAGDIRSACDVLRPVYDRTNGADGYASIEVSPLLARSTEETVAEAKRLWALVDRPNVMVKIPATAEGLPAIRQAIAAGVNINITLIFSVDVYERVAEAYLAGLEERVARGGDPSRSASVASFFVSRVDTLVDGQLAQVIERGDPARREAAKALVGTIAVANARVAYGRFKKIFSGPRWEALAARGARVQRPLWASTGTKNKAYSDVKYVEELVSKDTVNTMPPDTIKAFTDHGKAVPFDDAAIAQANDRIARLAGAGVSLAAACDQLERDGVRLFAESFKQLMDAIESRRAAVRAASPEALAFAPGPLAAAVEERLAACDRDHVAKRLWDRDVTLWSAEPAVGKSIARRLGWLDLPSAQRDALLELEAFADQVAKEGFTDAVVLGMGGSSLCPDLWARTFPARAGRLRLHVLDLTDPVAVARIQRTAPPERTLYVVSTKSGNTIETLSFAEAFEAEVAATNGRSGGSHFVAITDPDSPLETLASRRGWRRTFLSPPDVGGRFSALAPFGLVPAALLGLPLEDLVARARTMALASSARVRAKENAGVWLGAVLGEAGRAGRDKITLVVAPEIAALGAWLEQLVAESTGKQGNGLVPVADEPLGVPGDYGDDRLFVRIGLRGRSEPHVDGALANLEQVGHPVVRLTLDDALDVAGEFVRWEVATAVAAHVLGVNAFDEPDVSKSKANTQKALDAFTTTGALPGGTALVREGATAFFTGGVHGWSLRPAVADDAHGGGEGGALARVLAAHFASVRPGDYLALLAYLGPTPEEAALLARMRARLFERLGVATTLGLGPRYLHSTGQLHKGGPNRGVFLVLTFETKDDRPIPRAPYSFGVLLDAQAAGDVEALVESNRRVVRVHLEDPRVPALAALLDLVERALDARAHSTAVHGG